MGHRTAAEGHRVLVLAPFGRDADSVAGLLQQAHYDVEICRDSAAVAASLDEHVGVVLVTEEGLAGEQQRLKAAIAAQPAWSDPPFVLLAAPRAGRAPSVEAIRERLPAFINAVVLERPLGAASLISAVASAMRSRQKQFEMRDRLADLEVSRRALAASEAELRLVADALPMLIGFVDRALIYRFANRAYETWLGLSPGQVIGQTVTEVLGEAATEARLAAMQLALSGEPVLFEVEWPHPDGRARFAKIRYLPQIRDNGVVDGFHTFVEDVTEQKLAEQRLEQRVASRTAELEREMAIREQAEAALRQSQKMEAVGQLTGGIAHDFNNMLTGVIGGLDIVKRRIADGRYDDLDRFMNAALTSAQRAAALTARLLAFSRRQSLDPRPTDVNALARSLEDLLRRTIPETVSLRIVTTDDLPHALTDGNQLENAILNLAINARDAMPEGGQLTIETAIVELDDDYAAAKPDVKPGRYVMVAVSDTGVGMSEDLLAKVFEPFFTTKPIGQGTGLGLSMVYGFAQQSGGQIRVHSQPGEGTSVKLYLPATETTVAGSAQQSDVPVPEGTGQTVLLVEDDLSVRMLVRDVLEELSYTTIEAGDATEAVPILSSNTRIDLMISDVGLPGMNGRQLAEVARTHRGDLPILFVTGYAENAAIRAGFLGTNMAMITKPFSLDDLATKIGEMVATSMEAGRPGEPPPPSSPG
ncbi:PAS domain-containing sensor histidine kinase [Croceibacterium mercuriale]|uniref:PAS domain-containing sensor histidine kinase n=1 Tax=Croceibacterium mercuriale TaxID=1572751 RepID=UPI0006913C8A|nr:PAS domain-containing sensor histidine kinase [Croceibacterium mercuriale]